MTKLTLDEHDFQFGVFMLPERWPYDNWTLSYRRLQEEAKHYDWLGLDELWIGEHHSGGFENVPSPEMMLANLAPITDDIKLATGVISAPHSDPFQDATSLIFLDHLTQGRLIAGVGGGGIPSDQWLFAPHDIDPDGEDKRAKMNEAVDIIQTYLNAEEPTSYDGDFWQYEDRMVQTTPYQDEIPLGMPGFTTTNSFELCGSEGFISLSQGSIPITRENNPNFPSLKDISQELVDSAKTAGRDPKEARKNWRVVREVYVAESKEQALEDIRAGAEQTTAYYNSFGFGDLYKKDVDMPDEDLTLEWKIENQPWIIGSPHDCIRQIKALYEEVGGFGGLLFRSHDWVPQHKKKKSAELLAREVLPAFKDNLGPRKWVLDQLNYSSPEPTEDVFKIENSTPRGTYWHSKPNDYSAGNLDL